MIKKILRYFKKEKKIRYYIPEEYIEEVYKKHEDITNIITRYKFWKFIKEIIPEMEDEYSHSFCYDRKNGVTITNPCIERREKVK